MGLFGFGRKKPSAADASATPPAGSAGSDRGDASADPAQQDEAQARKGRSVQRLQREGVPVNPHLPAIEPSAGVTLRDPRHVARRATVLALVAARAEPDGMPLADCEAFLKQRGVYEELTPAEREFIALDDPDEEERAQFTWRYEGVYVLLWALGHIPNLGKPEAPCDVSEVVPVIVQTLPEQFESAAKLRDKAEILDQADLIYRYNWACTEARIHGKPPPAGLHPGVVYERHYALNWLIGYLDQDWDDVGTDT